MWLHRMALKDGKCLTAHAVQPESRRSDVYGLLILVGVKATAPSLKEVPWCLYCACCIGMAWPCCGWASVWQQLREPQGPQPHRWASAWVQRAYLELTTHCLSGGGSRNWWDSSAGLMPLTLPCLSLFSEKAPSPAGKWIFGVFIHLSSWKHPSLGHANNEKKLCVWQYMDAV